MLRQTEHNIEHGSLILSDSKVNNSRWNCTHNLFNAVLSTEQI